MDKEFGARIIPVDPSPKQTGHSGYLGYYKRQTAGLRNFARILTGRYDELENRPSLAPLPFHHQHQHPAPSRSRYDEVI
jgi:hypothetical protein